MYTSQRLGSEHVRRKTSFDVSRSIAHLAPIALNCGAIQPVVARFIGIGDYQIAEIQGFQRSTA